MLGTGLNRSVRDAPAIAREVALRSGFSGFLFAQTLARRASEGNALSTSALSLLPDTRSRCHRTRSSTIPPAGSKPASGAPGNVLHSRCLPSLNPPPPHANLLPLRYLRSLLFKSVRIYDNNTEHRYPICSTQPVAEPPAISAPQPSSNQLPPPFTSMNNQPLNSAPTPLNFFVFASAAPLLTTPHPPTTYQQHRSQQHRPHA